MPSLNGSFLSPTNENIRPNIYFVQPFNCFTFYKQLFLTKVAFFKFLGRTVNDICVAPTPDVRKAILVLYMVGNDKL